MYFGNIEIEEDVPSWLAEQVATKEGFPARAIIVFPFGECGKLLARCWRDRVFGRQFDQRERYRVGLIRLRKKAG